MVNRGSKDIKTKQGKVKVTPIEKQGDWGLYFWQLPSGRILGDAEGNILNIPGRIHDFSAMSKIQAAAKECGYPDGKALFKPHISRVTEDEHREQIGRMKEGLIPSFTDQGAWAAAKQGVQRWGDNDDSG